MDKLSRCQWPKCEAASDIIYLGCGLCDKHWTKSCDMEPEAVRKKLGIKEVVVEVPMETIEKLSSIINETNELKE